MALPWIIGAAAVAAVGAIAKSISDDNEREQRERERARERERELEREAERRREDARRREREEAERRKQEKEQEKRNFAREQLNVLLNDFSIAKSTISFDSVVNEIIENKQEDVNKYFQDKLQKKHENNGQLARIDELSQKKNELNSLLGKLGD